MDVGLHDHREQGPVDAPAPLEDRWEELPWRSLGIVSSTSPAFVVTSFGRVPLRWFVRLSPFMRTGADHLGCFRVDERLEDHLHARADQIDIATRTEHVEELGQVKLGEGHRVISFCMIFGRITQRFTRWPTSTGDLQELHHSKGHDPRYAGMGSP